MDRFALWRVEADGVRRWATGSTSSGPDRMLGADVALKDLLGDGDDLVAAARRREVADAPGEVRPVAPIDEQDVWASGVTFERSREARLEESDSGGDFYDKVYVAERPELFYKAKAVAVRGPGEPIGVRADSPWNVPEPEVGLVVTPSGTIAALTVANDVSSRSIEGENPLYLPQAKVYRGSCALGPCLVPMSELPAFDKLQIELRVMRGDAVAYDDTVPLRIMHRSPEELVSWLFRALDFEDGVVLLTGTSIVPPTEFTLLAGDVVEIEVPEIGCLANTVELVG